ncbi:MAG: FAD-dependent oxidoreductase [Candidatus Pacebacteria bacterium]|nr:FAD-dependent oxidoreductase [Candidatus Paceibacterota bacterium]
MYDLIIVGAGPAGLTASIYASRYKINHLVLGDMCGSALGKAHLIENWPGEKSIGGFDLLNKFSEQAKGLGGEILAENMVAIEKEGDIFKIKTSQDKTLESRAVIICSGTKERRLGIPGEEEFLGRGVSYCAICDAAFFKNKTVAVAGGGNSAVMAALMLSEHADKVYLIHRNDNFRAEPVMLERAKANSKITIIAGFNIEEVKGDKRVEKILLDKEYEGSKELPLDGLFVEIGMIPNGVLLKDLGVDIDALGHIVVDAAGATDVAGLYAAGDVSSGSNGIRQVLSASSEGMIGTSSVYNFLKIK